MLTKLNVYSSQSSSPELPLSSSGIGSDPLQIRNITGLGPVNADINTTANGVFKGENFNGSFVGKRNIVLTIGLNPDWEDQSMNSLRTLLYAYFMTGLLVTLDFESTNYPVVRTKGYVESFEPNMFSKDPEVQVSILCPEPDFVAVEPTVITGEVTDGSETIDVEYIGTSATGILIRVLANDDVPEFEGVLWIHLPTVPEPATFVIDPITIDSAHFLRMASIPGEKRVELVTVSTGVGVSKLSAVQTGSKWPMLYPGINPFAVLAYDSELLGQSWDLTYYARFGGL